MSQTATSKKVYFLLYDEVQLLDISGPAEVLAQANQIVGRSVYDIKYVGSSSSNKVKSSAGLPLVVEPLPPVTHAIDIIIVPGAEHEALSQIRSNEEVMIWLDQAAKHAKTRASVCTGAFLLGQLGYLDNHLSTTHWKGTQHLQREFPNTKVQQDTLYTHDHNLWTSAGVMCGVDMTLAMVNQDLGAKTALEIARSLVVSLFREGGQSQFSGAMELQSKAHQNDIINLIAWLEAKLQQTVTVEQMAEYLNTSVRTLHRRCIKALDMTPAQVLNELRLDRARELLHQPNIPVKSIAYECGYSSQEALSSAFKKRFGVAPKRYRERFSLS
ncbi:GlxA family transcriptional regulator [Pleionea sp. CnH1-48]|uniref:GlxA family transcriptional regulator n=1 Tax=Pleionea sp. CnH1-48 TaxID=2954494 RepID=UPI002097F7D2|nr:helix-turn-helix domain-containing protein [Pleionea sp. CnH1-48]MCO7227486.1 helix-turn-helix domain-containing protein [Pleionea sp. CnH1-48]